MEPGQVAVLLELHWQLPLLLWAGVPWQIATSLSVQSQLEAPPAVWWHPAWNQGLLDHSQLQQALRVDRFSTRFACTASWGGVDVVWSAWMVAEHQLHGHHSTHSLQPCPGRVGGRPLLSCTMQPLHVSSMVQVLSAPSFTTKSCCSSYKSGLPVALQLLSPQACRTCATALQRHTALVNTMASSCGDYVGQQKEFVRTCTTWCLAHTHTMRSRICSHSLLLSKTVVPWPWSVGFFTLLLLSGGTSAGRPALRPQGGGGVPGSQSLSQHEGVSALRLPGVCVQ